MACLGGRLGAMAVKEPTRAGRGPMVDNIRDMYYNVYYRCVHQNAKGIVRCRNHQTNLMPFKHCTVLMCITMCITDVYVKMRRASFGLPTRDRHAGERSCDTRTSYITCIKCITDAKGHVGSKAVRTPRFTEARWNTGTRVLLSQ